jgi:hypothetical protein
MKGKFIRSVYSVLEDNMKFLPRIPEGTELEKRFLCQPNIWIYR